MHILSLVLRNGSDAAADRVLSVIRRRALPVVGVQVTPTETGLHSLRITLDTDDGRVVDRVLTHMQRNPDVLAVELVPCAETASTPLPHPVSNASALQQIAVADRPMCSASEGIIRALQAEGVECAFGYPGGAILPVYDALLASPIRHILTRHEQAAVHAAEGYAKASGRVGVVLATSGPGATNLVTGLLDALMDSVPLVAITGQVPRSLLGRDAFQEADVLGITMSATKHNYLVKNPADLLPTIREAFHLARSGRPGPVLVDIPKDVANAQIPYEYPPVIATHLGTRVTPPSSDSLSRAAAALLAAQRPVILCGGGVVSSPGAPSLLAETAELLQAPIAVTLQGLGGVSGMHPLHVGLLGMHGLYAANMAVQHADLLLAVGMRFDDRVTGKLERFAPHARVIHIDIDPAEVGKNVQPYVGLVGDAAMVLGLLRDVVATEPIQPGKTAPWLNQIRAWHRQHPVWIERRRRFRVPVVNPVVLDQVAAASLAGLSMDAPALRTEDVMRSIQVVFGPESTIVSDVGQHQMWAAHFCLREEPRSFISSGGLGTMGFALPAGIGTSLARPDRQTVVLAGDGGFQMNLQELATVVAERIPLRMMVINNGYLGMVRQWQQLFYEGRYSAVDMRAGMPDLVQLAEAYGIRALRVDRPDAVPWAVQEAQGHPGPILVEFRVEPEENVYPMVSPGSANDDMLLG